MIHGKDERLVAVHLESHRQIFINAPFTIPSVDIGRTFPSSKPLLAWTKPLSLMELSTVVWLI